MDIERRTRLALGALAGAYFLLGTSSLSVVALLPAMTSDLGLPPAAIASLVTVFALAFAVAAPLAQMLVGDRPRRTLLIVGLVVLSIATGLAAFASGYDLLFATRLIAGLGAATVGPMISAIGAGLVPPAHQGRALSQVFSGMMFSMVIGVPACAWFGELAGWRGVLLGLSVLGLLTAAAVAVLVRDRGRGHRVGPRALLRAVADRRTGLGVATTFLQMAANFCSYALVSRYVLERLGGQPTAAATVLLVFGIAGVAGNYLAGPLSDRIGADRTVAFSLLSMGAAFIALALMPPSVALSMPAIVGWSIANSLFQAPQQKRLVSIDPASRGLLLALNSAALYLGMSVGAFLAGALHETAGIGALPVGSAAISGLAAIAFAAARRPGLPGRG